MIRKIQALVGYISAVERTFAVGCVRRGVAAASALKMPWSAVFVVISVISVLIPDGAMKKPKA